MLYFLLGFLFLWICLYMPIIPCFIFNFPFVIYYIFYGTFMYFKEKRWKKFNKYGIRICTGMFGKGKTLTSTYCAMKWYKKYGDSLLFLSNYKLSGIPYTQLVSFEQLVVIQETWQHLENLKNEISRFKEKQRKYGNLIIIQKQLDRLEPELRKCQKNFSYQGVVVLIDEIELLLNNRKYSDFPLELLHTLCQQRKFKMVILATAQRFGMVDIAFRRITTFVEECNKLWRFQCIRVYDAWEVENAINPKLIKPIGRRCFFVRNKLFKSYDTTQSITRENTADFISNKESLERKGYTLSNLSVVNKLSKRGKKLL